MAIRSVSLIIPWHSQTACYGTKVSFSICLPHQKAPSCSDFQKVGVVTLLSLQSRDKRAIFTQLMPRCLTQLAQLPPSIIGVEYGNRESTSVIAIFNTGSVADGLNMSLCDYWLFHIYFSTS